MSITLRGCGVRLGLAFFAGLLALSPPLRAAPVMTAVGEVTDNAKARAGASAGTQVYYALQSGGFRAIGSTVDMSPIPVGGIERALQSAVATLGYQAASDAHPPTVLVTFNWGVYSLPPAYDAKILLDRAAFIGGRTFAAAFRKAMEESDVTSMATPSAPDASYSAAVGVRQMAAINDPLRRFGESSTKNNALLTQMVSEVYYVIVSAYDAQSVAANKRQLLWRTRMSIQAEGISPDDGLPRLIQAATPFLGKSLGEAEILAPMAPRGKAR